MGFVNRTLIFFFAVLAIIVGIFGWAVLFGITSFEFIDAKIGFLGWVVLGIIWMIGAFRLLLLSFSSFNNSKSESEDRLISKNSTGEMVITPEVVLTMTKQALKDIPGLHDLRIEPYFQKGKMEIGIHLNASADQNLPALIKEIQTKVSNHLQSQTGVKPEGVIVEVGKILPVTEEIDHKPSSGDEAQESDKQ